MKSKRILCLLVVAMMMMTLLLSGCGASKPEEAAKPAEGAKPADTAKTDAAKPAAGPVEITFWNLFGGGEGDFVDKIVKDFNASQQEVVVKALRLDSQEYYAKLGTALSSGKGPDVGVVHQEKMAPFVNAKQLAALDDVAAKVGLNYGDFTENNANGVLFNGKHYAVPLDTHFMVMYFNTKPLENAGLLNDDKTPKLGDVTPEGYKKFLQAIKDKNPNVTPLSVNVPYFHEPFLNAYYETGGEVVVDGKVAVDKEKAVQVLKWYMDLFDSKLADLNDKTPWDTFNSGKSAVWWSGVWEAAANFADTANPKACIPIPPVFGSPKHWAGSHTLAMPAYVDASKQEAVLKFMKYFTYEGGKTWAQAGHVPASKAAANSDEFNKLPFRNYFKEAQTTVKFAPATDKWNSIDMSMRESLQQIIFKKVAPEAGVDNMIKNIDDILNK